MATYEELYELKNYNPLKYKVTAAVVIAAEAIRTEVETTPSHANRVLWAQEAFSNPTTTANQMLWAVLAANKDVSEADIKNATDAAVQTQVDAAVDMFADGS